MNHFLKKFIVFCLALVLLIFTGIKIYYYLAVPKGENIVYIWGDSQICNGLDLDYLNHHSRYHFYTAAEHGAGLYDFLVFCQLIPDNSSVLIQISRPALLRSKNRDRNISAFNFPAFRELRKNHFTNWELYGVFRKNLFPHQLFSDINEMYPNDDTIKMTEPFSTFQSLFETEPDYLSDKMKLYETGIDWLMKKHCKVAAIIYPQNKALADLELTSVFRGKLVDFDTTIAARFPIKKKVVLPSGPNLFYDLSHLNHRGATWLTRYLSTSLTFTDSPTLVRVVLPE